MNLKMLIKKSLNVYIIIVLGTVLLASCSTKICSSYARSEDRVFRYQKAKNINNGFRSIQFPFTSQTSLQQKYYNR